MCRETFQRLPEEKKRRFLNAAWEEFGRVPFSEASINKIVLGARIPRGSFYQYFADKHELFFYLLGSMMQSYLQDYAKMLEQAEGDMFRTQVNCFDRVLVERNTDPLFERGLKILHMNLPFLVECMLQVKVAHGIWDAVREKVNCSAFREKNEELARQTFIMSLVVLVMSMADAMGAPDRTEECRQELLFRLDVLKHGSLAARGE